MPIKKYGRMFPERSILELVRQSLVSSVDWGL